MSSKKCLFCHDELDNPYRECYCDVVCYTAYTQNLGEQKLWEDLKRVREDWDTHYKRRNMKKLKELDKMEEEITHSLIQVIGSDDLFHLKAIQEYGLRQIEKRTCQQSLQNV